MLKNMFVYVVTAISSSRILNVVGYPLTCLGYSDLRLLGLLERLFPLKETLPQSAVEGWQSPEVYYFLDDPSPCVGKRLWAILRLDRNAVSFWRKRQQFLKLKGWESVTINQHVS